MNYNGYKVLITGYGFVGQYLADYLASQKAEITIMDRNLDHLSKLKNTDISLIKTDIKYLGKDLTFDFVFHTASVTNVGYAEANPIQTYEDNVTATLNLLKHLTIKKRLIFTSSAVVYGATGDGFPSETSELRPISIYGLSKVTAENLIQHFGRLNKFDYNIFRFFNIYGAGQQKYYLIPQFINQAMTEKKIEMWNTTTKRDYIYIEDVVKGVADIPLREDSKNEIVNIGTGMPTASGEVAKMIIKILDKPIKFTDKNYHDPASPEILVANNEKALKFGLKPSTSLEQGLRKMMRIL